MDLVLEQNDYRPFGERVDDERMEVDGENRYRFAGKEEQTFLNGTISNIDSITPAFINRLMENNTYLYPPLGIKLDYWNSH